MYKVIGSTHGSCTLQPVTYSNRSVQLIVQYSLWPEMSVKSRVISTPASVYFTAGRLFYKDCC